MPKKSKDTELTEKELVDGYLDYGNSYYAAGRFAFHNQLAPVAATLFHHAVEMYLKAGICTVVSTAERKKLGHDLEALWKRMRALDAAIPESPNVLVDLNHFEGIRYPESLSGFSSGPAALRTFRLESDGATSGYEIWLHDVDELVVTIHDLLKLEPHFRSPSTEARQVLGRDNRQVKKWTFWPA